MTEDMQKAREMEKKGRDARHIKIATGWERGTDGKWRYEQQDFIFVPKGVAQLQQFINKQPWASEYIELAKKKKRNAPMDEVERMLLQ